jgi:hypothetical protein
MRLTEAYESALAFAEHHNDDRFSVRTPIDNIFPSGSYVGHVEGRYADVNERGEPIARPVDFSNADRWSICAVYARVYHDGSPTGWELYTMYPASDVGQRRGVRDAPRGDRPLQFDERWIAPSNTPGELRSRRPRPPVNLTVNLNLIQPLDASDAFGLG